MDFMNLLTMAVQPVADEHGWNYIWAVVITGLSVVFLALVILIAFVWLMGKIFKAIEKSRKKKKSTGVKVEPEASQKKEAAVQTVSSKAAASGDSDEVIAVIAAAVAAMGQADGKKYRVRSVKAAGNRAGRSAWSMAGLQSDTTPF